ncbi:MerR family transcriptional regulator [Actinopolymorpha alba]|uniref:MerR family transcriptional regulator n=1 Tax=Actinopolymorpha alba TaxID=533267 RepID=UPI00035CAEF1|nr:MerR family transcriptional regulator [Actinopolymorpha alba]
MELLTIGAFARAAGLSPKALRLYASLGLLAPVRVDPDSGYRFYDPAQLERARLVAWLRRFGMPLARIQVVCDLWERSQCVAADEIAAYWAEVETDLANRRRLATFLVDQLSRRETDMSETSRLRIRYAVATDKGQLRDRNADSAYAGPRLLAVADGVGAGPAGERASAAVVESLKPLDSGVPSGDLLNALEHAVRRANDTLRDVAASDPALGEVGTTLTALLWSDSSLGLVHVGDSRAYLLRDQEVFQITHDHTYVRSLVDAGRITAEEAESHPQRALLLRALDGRSEPQPDLSLWDSQVGDRHLLCSDGLSAVVSEAAIRDAMILLSEPDQVVRRLIDLAFQAGAPDNVSCVVADVVES